MIVDAFGILNFHHPIAERLWDIAKNEKLPSKLIFQLLYCRLRSHSSVAICSAFLSLVLRNQGLATVRAIVSVGREFVGTVYWELPIQQLPSALYLLSAETAGGRHQLVVNEKLVL